MQAIYICLFWKNLFCNLFEFKYLIKILLYFYSASDEEAELAAAEEEEEALSLQKRMAERLDEDDFFAFDKV